MRETEPTIITTREEVHWQKTYCDYPASLWQLDYYFRGPGVGFNAAWGVEVTADGDTFDIVVPGTKTDDMTVAGDYVWQAWLTEIADTTNKFKIGEGHTTVVLGFDPASTATIDLRSTAKKILDAIDATLQNTATSDQLSYEISTPAGTTKISKMSRTELIELRTHYAMLVAREIAAERRRRTGKFGRQILINVRER